jgi:uncharacterized protein (TIGR02231 family)
MMLGLCLVVASGLPIDHKITAVTVYRDRALVTRSGNVNLIPGVNSIVFDKLPVNLDENSIRARGEGAVKFKILGLELKRQYQDRTLSAELTKLQNELRKVDDQLRVNNDDRNDVEQKRSLLNELRNKMVQMDLSVRKPASNATNQISAATFKGMFDFYGTELSELSERIRQIEWNKRALQEQRDKLTRQIAVLQRPADPDTRSAVVTVESSGAGSAQIEVNYIMRGATWNSQYDAHALTNERKIEFTYYGVVQQTTGENWDDVKLSLSTARPAGGARIPELSPWYINVFDPNVPMPASASVAEGVGRGDRSYHQKLAKSQMQSSVNASVEAFQDSKDEEARKNKERAEMAVAQVNDTGPAAVFVVPGKVTIPSDGQPHRSTVDVQTFAGEWQYEATPKLVPAAFLKARVINSSPAPLLPGNINAFLENDFIGRAWIGLVPPRSGFDLFLGVDDGIKVTRTAGVDKEESSGVISKSKVFKRGYTIEVENFKKADVACKINDQIPVSKNGELKVDVIKMSPAPKKKDDNTGQTTWELLLKPQEKMKIEVEFQVECDPKKQVIGL